jgi:hypothetical protein
MAFFFELGKIVEGMRNEESIPVSGRGYKPQSLARDELSISTSSSRITRLVEILDMARVYDL